MGDTKKAGSFGAAERGFPVGRFDGAATDWLLRGCVVDGTGLNRVGCTSDWMNLLVVKVRMLIFECELSSSSSVMEDA